MAKIDYFNYIQVLDLLKSFKNRLEEIYQAYLNEEFEIAELDYSDPFKVLQFYVESKAYKQYSIHDLAVEIKGILEALNPSDYSFADYIRIEEEYGMDHPLAFDSRWTLVDVYKYLLSLVNSEGLIIMENSIVNGELLRILNCFLIRV